MLRVHVEGSDVEKECPSRNKDVNYNLIKRNNDLLYETLFLMYFNFLIYINWAF